jgi:hypothetical protein
VKDVRKEQKDMRYAWSVPEEATWDWDEAQDWDWGEGYDTKTFSQ